MGRFSIVAGTWLILSVALFVGVATTLVDASKHVDNFAKWLVKTGRF